jgi:hypothetical protein
MTAQELIELADRTICQMFSDTGSVPEARVWIHTKKRLMSIPCKPKGPAKEAAMRALICAMIYGTRKAGTFEGAVLMAEAWMSTIDSSKQKSYPMPSMDPNRIEVAILLAYGADGKVEALARRIERRNGKRAVGGIHEPFNKPGMIYSSWLDAAFKVPQERNGNGKH